MKKVLLAVSLFAFSLTSQALRLKLPSQQILTKSFVEGGFKHFIEKTDIIEHLAGQEVLRSGVSVEVDLALHAYAQYTKDPMMASIMQMSRPKIIKLILQDSKPIKKAKSYTCSCDSTCCLLVTTLSLCFTYGLAYGLKILTS